MKHASFAVFVMASIAALPLWAHAETREYNLSIGSRTVSIEGHATPKITINGAMPGPTLRFNEGDDAVIHVTNTLKSDTSIHWHGMIVPGSQDGVPGFNGFDGIRPGQTFTYRFKIKQAGTYWYHAHSMGQEQDGLLGGLVIDPAAGSSDAALTAPAGEDYVIVLTDESPETADQIQSHLKANADYYQYHRRTVGDFFDDIGKMGLGKALKSAGMWGRMNMRPTDLADVEGYTYEINGLTPAENWTGLFKPGEKVRLRFINAGAMTMFDVRIPGLKMTVVAADGQPVEPVSVDEFRIGNAETYDVIVEPQAGTAYTIAAESLDRTGFALGTLAPREGMKGPVPAERPRAVLTMADMNMQKMMKDDPNMDMSMMDMPAWGDHHAPAGTRILDYSDLKYAGRQADIREPSREISVHLDGNMERYIWTMNGKTFDPAVGIHVAYNERVRISFVNDSMMAHPMHLHGMFVQLDNGQPADKMPNKHTVIVPPGQTVSVILTADNAGTWAFHCHLMNHMLSGMMTDLVVSGPGQPVLADDRTADGAPAKPLAGMAPPPMAAGMDMKDGGMSGMDMKGASGAAANPSQAPLSGVPGMTMDRKDVPMNPAPAQPAANDTGATDMPTLDMSPAKSGAAGATVAPDAKGTVTPPAKKPAKPKPKPKAKPKTDAMPGMHMSQMNMGGDHAH
jgi:FtsP/CotA-like multicopper oxidase with cupredoxin domain